MSHIYQWFLRCYDKDIKDKTNLYTSIQTNAAYKVNPGRYVDGNEREIRTLKIIMSQRPDEDIRFFFCNHVRMNNSFVSKDKSSMKIVTTNSIVLFFLLIKGLTHPTEKNADGKYVPNFQYRYLLEDIPFGLLVMRGVAALAEVQTPTMDKVKYVCLQ